MALKRKLTEQIERMGLIEAAQAVHIHVPAIDPGDDLVRASEVFNNTVAELVRERNEIRQKNEQLNRKCVFLMKTNERVENERDWWRKQAAEYIRANGELAATLGGMLAFAERAAATMQQAQAIADAMPQPNTAVAGTNDAAIDDGPPPINIEELHLQNGITSPTRAIAINTQEG